MKVILPISEVPHGAIVTKPTGEKRYEVADKINIFGNANVALKVEQPDNVRFMIPVDMSMSGFMAVTPDYSVAWEISEEDLYSYLGEKLRY